MNNQELRDGITRTLKYTIVTKTEVTGEETQYIVNGKTTIKKELTKHLKDHDTIPQITVKEVAEQRFMTLNDFIKNSILLKGEVL